MSQGSPSQPNLSMQTRLPSDSPIAQFFANPANRFGVASNIDVSGRAGLAIVLKCTSKPTVPAEELERTAFPVKYYYAHATEMTDQRTGEVTERVRLVLVSPEGETTSFVSFGVIHSLDTIRRYLGDGPYDPPLKVKVVRDKTRSGGEVAKLEMVEDAEASEASTHGRRNK